LQVRKATLADLTTLVEFTSEEVREAEPGGTIPPTLEAGVKKGLEDETAAMYWLLVDDAGHPVGSVSALREWSDWHAGYYWWIQSIYLKPAQRGKGLIQLLLNAVKDEMLRQSGLELRLYVHRQNLAAIKAYLKVGFARSPYDIMVYRGSS